MTTAVDTNVVLALLYDDAHADASEAALRQAYRDGNVVVTPVVYAELAADGQFGTADALDTFLADMSIQLAEPSRGALVRAGEQFGRYADRRPDGLQCPSCGAEQSVDCDTCGNGLAPRQHIAADFLIGAHATVDCDALLSFDEGFYETYFPSLTVRPA
ncbi:type II toxin-antitoxin system VapC family toxin [Haloarcula salinisoli]|uniref:Type II toxin-antitoxin system VapC family toxin n=1 Tax=Haloarcula salinisoli TaxID=2487746 RepID=A0A8J7YDJ6_9EURY|nr:type II toxin-antitoxin system VapC family toxin [Halomicroarcula salinisoli]MBX0286585.1 type II toxin-antitoxin system VapC family toxin [Halomicroarcula salinisoli]MBX0303935.1 type II toxin-antitoxin system VapC family toxin [Halomicroarcula salinisoli]